MRPGYGDVGGVVHGVGASEGGESFEDAIADCCVAVCGVNYEVDEAVGWGGGVADYEGSGVDSLAETGSWRL